MGEGEGEVGETQAWKPGSQHAGEKRGVAGLLLGRTERAARAAELQLCVRKVVNTWRRKWQPTPVFLPGESQGQGSLVGFHLWGRIESDTTEAT